MRFRTLVAGLSLALGAAPALADECKVGKIAILPITMRGLRAYTGAKINGREWQFMVDSGAFYSVISPGVATENSLKLMNAPFGLYMRGIGGSATVNVTRVKTFTLAGTDIPNIDFIVGGSEVGVGGVIGQNILHIADVEYDLSHSIVNLMQAKGCGNTTLAYWADSQPISMLPLVDNAGKLAHTQATITVNGRPIRAAFDTGATTVISTSAAAKLGIRPDSPGVVEAGYGGGFGSKMVKAWIIPVTSIGMGGEAIHNAHIRMTDLGGDTEMLIGADFFLTHRVYVANSQNKIYFTYSGGNFFNAGEGGKTPIRAVDATGSALDLKDTAADPTDAEGFSRRGMARLAQRDREGALADLDKAVSMGAAEPRYLYQRAMVQQAFGRPQLALADLDKAIGMKPDFTDALMARAGLRLRTGRRAEAEQDADAASKALNAASNTRLALAGLYDALELLEKAIPEFDRWIGAHPVDNDIPSALNGRCWARARLNRDLDKALADCNTAIRKMVRKEAGLDSRALVHLRRGEFADAIKDYDAALAVNPKMAVSLYGRGVAKAKMGQKDAGEKDIAAATELNAKDVARIRKWGVAP